MRKFINIVEASAAPQARSEFIAYHGAGQEIEEWDDCETYLASSAKEALSYCRAGSCLVYKYWISIRNPYRTDDYDEFAGIYDRVRDLQEQGYDGVIYGNDDQFVVFSPAQMNLLTIIRNPRNITK